MTYALWDSAIPHDEPSGIVFNDVPLVEVLGLENTFANRVLVMTQWAISFISNRRGVRIFPVACAEPMELPSGEGVKVEGVKR